jgi:hypothetical protein
MPYPDDGVPAFKRRGGRSSSITRAGCSGSEDRGPSGERGIEARAAVAPGRAGPYAGGIGG